MSEHYPINEAPDNSPNFDGVYDVLSSAIAKGHQIEGLHSLDSLRRTVVLHSADAVKELNDSIEGQTYGMMLTYTQGWAVANNELMQLPSFKQPVSTTCILEEFTLISNNDKQPLITAMFQPIAFVAIEDKSIHRQLAIPVTSIVGYTYTDIRELPMF